MPFPRIAFPRALARLAPVAVLAIACAAPALASWPFEVHSGVPLCRASGDQTLPQIVSDGAGGAIVVWTDLRSGTADIYAQRVSRLGDPLWSPDGIAVCTFAGAQTLPRVIADGAGGAIVAWQDARGANLDLYAQRIAANGALLWPANGAPVCVLASDQAQVTLATDGAGGAILAWVDSRPGFLLEDIYAQRLNASGAAQWTLNGNVVCAAGSFQIEPRIVSDDAGGAIVTWTDWRATSDIYAQRMNAAGARQWGPDGLPVCVAASLQSGPVPVADGAGGAIIAWADLRTSATTSSDVYIQRLTPAGAPMWTLDGVAACADNGPQLNHAIASDGAGGVDIVWEDQSNPAPDSKLHWDHLGPNGYSTLYSNGCGYDVVAGSRPVLTRSGTTPMAAYLSNDTANRDPYVMRLVMGNFERSYGPACDATGHQMELAAAADDNSGLIVAWQDQRSGSADIWVHRLDNFTLPGITEPVITSVRDVAHDQGGAIKVSWLAAYMEQVTVIVLSDYRIWRAIPPDYVAAQARAGARVVAPDEDAASFEPGRTIMEERTAADIVYWEFVGSVPVSGLPGYSFIVPTISDSVADWNPRTLVRVQVWGASEPNYRYFVWSSRPDSGYSVDNLAPAQPSAFAGQYDGGSTALTWNANVEPDLAGYRLYRGSSPSFVPAPSNRIAEPVQPHFTDAAGSPYIYKLSAVDVHGNESPVATVIPAGTTDVPGPPAAAFFLAPPTPNPSRLGDGVRFRLGLPADGPVRLAIHDLSGRRVRLVAAAPMDAGEHTLRWDGRDGAGHRVAAGVYVVRLETNDGAAQRRVVLIE